MSSVDPVRARRARVGRLADLGRKLGYGLFGLACIAFVLAFASGFPGGLVVTVVASLLVGSLVLAPAIVAGYAVKAAEREDRERGL